MLNIVVNFDFNVMKASIKYNEIYLEKEFEVVNINNYTKMATISYQFNTDHKWSFNWLIWNKSEQFFEFNQYMKEDCIEKDPWKTFAKWSYISNPQKGTSQNNKVKCISYNQYLFPDTLNIKFNIVGNGYGDWNYPSKN